MTLQNLINEVQRRQIELLEQKESALSSLKTIKTDDKNLPLILSEAIHNYYAPLFRQCEIEIGILEIAQNKIWK